MGDARHKKPPPKAKFGDVTPLFLKQVAAALAQNDAHNTQHNLKRGDPGYKICKPGELADAVGADPNMIKHLLGGVRPGTKTKKVSRSRLVGPIREALGIEQMGSVLLPASIVAVVQRLAERDATKFGKALEEMEAQLNDQAGER
jgi:hypothetical protein